MQGTMKRTIYQQTGYASCRVLPATDPDAKDEEACGLPGYTWRAAVLGLRDCCQPERHCYPRLVCNPKGRLVAHFGATVAIQSLH
jgi:hypothetical protein